MTTWAPTAIPIFAPAAARPTGRSLLLPTLIVACIVSALLGRGVYLLRPFDHDAAMFIYLGKSVTDGDRFCHDVIDNKFPTVGLVTSVCWRAFGTNWLAYVIAQTALAGLGAWFLSRCAGRNFGRAARLPTMLAAVVYLNFTPCVFGGFQLETLQTFFSIISACAAVDWMHRSDRRDLILAGLAAGCAALLKPTGVAPLAALLIAVWLSRPFSPRKLASLLPAAVGLLIPLGVAALYITSIGIWRDMPALARQISDYASATPLQWDDLLKPITVIVVAGFGLFVRGWIFRRPEHPQRRAEPLPKTVGTFAVGWALLEFTGALAQRRMYAYHFLPLAAPVALLFGMLPRRASARSLAMALTPIIVFSLMGAREVMQYPDPRIPALPVSEYLIHHTVAGDSVWQDSMPRLLLETGLRPGGRYPIAFLFGNTDTAALEMCPVLLNDFERRKPKYIILPSDVDEKIAGETMYCAHLARAPARAANFAWAWRSINAYVQANYVAETRLRGDTVYRRKPI